MESFGNWKNEKVSFSIPSSLTVLLGNYMECLFFLLILNKGTLIRSSASTNEDDIKF